LSTPALRISIPCWSSWPEGKTAGFLTDNAESHGKCVEKYGFSAEFRPFCAEKWRKWRLCGRRFALSLPKRLSKLHILMIKLRRFEQNCVQQGTFFTSDRVSCRVPNRAGAGNWIAVRLLVPCSKVRQRQIIFCKSGRHSSAPGRCFRKLL
jgi:hypothetical protein